MKTIANICHAFPEESSGRKFPFIIRPGNKIVAFAGLLLFLFAALQMSAQNFVHPGIWHKLSDLDRMKYMVQARKEPWITSFNQMKADPLASFSYVVQKNPANDSLSRESPCNQCNQFESDARAAYLNSLMWYITGDQKHADKAIQILNAWSELTNFYGGGTEPLSAGIYARHIVNAAEILKHTNAGWAQADIDKFKAMLVYPGYSTTTVPVQAIANDKVTFYWRIYQGDPGRHGNQDLIPMLAMIEMGIFLDNEIMYDRGLRYLKGLPHRPDDLPYPGGPRVNSNFKSTIYYDEYTTSVLPANPAIPVDYGYNGQLQHYIWENGQLQEASRDQSHSGLGLGMYGEAGETVWNQGDNLYSLLDNRILNGMEYGLRYNTSFLKSYPDQPAPWEPTVESGEFIQRWDRTGRWFSKKINPWNGENYTTLTRGQPVDHPVWEMAVAHYEDRLHLSADSTKWTVRTRDLAIQRNGYEGSGFKLDAPGWGALTFRRPSLSPGDPIDTFTNGKPEYRMNVLPGKIEAENYDYFLLGGEGKTYHDVSASNTGGQYRTNEAVDIGSSSEGGYHLTALENGEWFNYTVAAPTAGKYKFTMRYAATAGGGIIKVEFDGIDRTGLVNVPFGGANSNGAQDWKDFTVAQEFTLQAGVQSMRVFISGTSNAFAINNFSINYLSALQSQTITFPALPAKFVGNPDFDPGATASSGLPVTYTSSNTSVATIVGNMIHIVGPGITTITASQAGNDIYSPAANVSQTLTVSGIAAGDYVSSGNMNWNGGTWNISNGTGGYSGTTTTVPSASTNVHILAGHTVTLATTAGAAKNLTVYSGATLLQQAALTVSGLTVISGTLTTSNTLTINDLTINGTGILASTTAPAGSVFSLITNKATTLIINGVLGATAGSAVTTIGSGIRIFVNGTGTTTFTGTGTLNIARFSPNSNNTASQTIIIDLNMEVRNYAGNEVASLSLQNGNMGAGNKILTINEGKTVTLNGQNGLGAFHGTYFNAYGNSAANSTGSAMTYNINGTLDCSNAQFNLVTNQQSDGNVVTVNVNGVLKLGSTVRLFRFRNAQKIFVNVADNAIVEGSSVALNQNLASSGQSINTSDFTGTAAVPTGLGGIAFSGNNPVIGTYSFVGSGGSGYIAPPTVFFTGGTLAANNRAASAIATITNGVVTAINVLTTSNYTVKPTGLQLVGGGVPMQWFTFTGSEQSGIVTRLVNANEVTPFWIGPSNTSYNPATVQPATGTVFTANVKFGNIPPGLPHENKAIGRTWSLQPATVSATGISFGYNNADANVNCNPADTMRLGSYSTGAEQWELLDKLSVPAAGAGTNWMVNYTGVDKFPVFNIINNVLEQLINFPALGTKLVGDADYDPGATASSGLPVSYTSSNTSVATILNGMIHIVGTGTTQITASQPGNNKYNAAPPVTRTLTVNQVFYHDYDRDSYGNPNATVQDTVSPGAGWVMVSGDCNDKRSDVHPGAQELPDNLDNDCDGSVDEGLSLTTFYHDYDRDGYGNDNATVQASIAPAAGWITTGGDCNDKNAHVYPGAPELPDNLDNNCNGVIDEGMSLITFYQDYDRDGYGNPNAIIRRSKYPGPGWTIVGGDCNDKKASINPDATEVLNGIDDNCNGSIDEGLKGEPVTGGAVDEVLTTAYIKVSAAPNPTNSLFTISIRAKKDQPVRIRVLNLLGVLVEQKLNIVPSNTIRIGGNYQPGTYFVEVSQGNEREVVKLVKL